MGKAELILQAAIEVFAEKGFFKATTGDISRQAGIAVGTIYNYFSSKDEILVKIFSAEAEKRQALARALEDKPLSTLEKLDLLLKHHLSALQANPALAKVVISEKSVVRKLSPEDFSPDGGMVKIIENIISKGQDNDDLHIRPLLIFGMIEITMERFLEHPQFDLDSAREELIQLLKTGLI